MPPQVSVNLKLLIHEAREEDEAEEQGQDASAAEEPASDSEHGSATSSASDNVQNPGGDSD
eukprot:12903778-Prorocentrum_lima.AAC.1